MNYKIPARKKRESGIQNYFVSLLWELPKVVPSEIQGFLITSSIRIWQGNTKHLLSGFPLAGPMHRTTDSVACRAKLAEKWKVI